MKTLESLILENEDWLVDRVVQYAVAQGFNEYTSTLREAWRASICGLSRPILDAIAAARTQSDSAAGFGDARDSIVTFGIEQAQHHRARGVRLADFLGLLKYYRRAYLDLVEENPLPEDDARRLRGYLLDFFDHVEIGLCGEWTEASHADRLRDLQDQSRKLTNEKNKYLTIFESIREPVILLDADHRPKHLNHAAHRLFCGDVAPGASYYGAWNSPLLNSQIAAMLDGASDSSFDSLVETLSGPREFNINIQKMLDISHKFEGTVIILNDVSEYKRALRRAEAADQAKSTFLAAMSHEIRTPIAGVLGLARLLEDTELSPQQARHVAGIISSGELLAGVVGDILDFSRAEVGGRVPVPTEFEPGALVRQVLMVLEHLAEENGLRLEADIDPDLPPRLRGDTAMIRQLLVNLIHNAIKFTETGEVRVRVMSRQPGDGAVCHLRFEVIDTGIGLPEVPTDWLFGAFTQHHGRGAALKGGVGLGLAICRKITGQMGGEIGCRPNPGGGSVFFVDLDLPAALPVPASAAARQTPPARGALVLVVDDDDVNRAVAEGFLEKLGHRARSAASAHEALRRLETERFDLVLSDNRMPGISGLELLSRIRALKTGPNAGVPVVIVTASVGDLEAIDPSDLRPDGTLGKPYDAVALARVLADHLPGVGEAVNRDRPGEDTGNDTGAGAGGDTGDDTGDDGLSTLRAHVQHLGPERGRRIIQAFIDTAPERLEALRRGAAEGAPEMIAATAHSLAGAASLLGLTEIAEQARTMEARAGTGQVAVSESDLAELEAAVLELVTRLAGDLASGWPGTAGQGERSAPQGPLQSGANPAAAGRR